jgi:hypothetical protein
MTIVYCDPQLPKPPIKPVEAPPPPDETTIELVVDNRGWQCKHAKVVVDAKTRIVTCRLCNAALDPFDALLTIADKSDRLSTGVAWKRRAVAQLEQQERHLKAIVSRLKSELRKLGIPYSIAHTHNIEYLAQLSGIPADDLKNAQRSEERFVGKRKKPKLEALRGGKGKPPLPSREPA